MHVTIEDLKSHVFAFIAREKEAAGSEAHKLVARFAVYVEGRQALNDAIALVRENGFEVREAPLPAAAA